MDGSFTVGSLVAATGASAPRVRRATTGLGTRTAGGHRRFTASEMAEAVARLGTTPRELGLTRIEIQALAALARSPAGLRSVRSVARRSGLSPTSAGVALDSLREKRLATVARETVAEGRPVEVDVWRLVIGEAWFNVADRVSRTVPPRRDGAVPPRRVPRRFWHYFWSGDPSRLRLPQDADFVARRLLGVGDLVASAWAISHLPTESFFHFAQSRGPSAPERALARNAVESW